MGTVVRTPGVRPWNQCLKSYFLLIWQLLAPLSSQPRVHKGAGTTTGWVLMWNGDSGADTWYPAMEPMSQIMFTIIWQLLAPFTSQPRVHKWAGSTTGWVLMRNGDSGADTWCPAMERMSQIMFYNHLATFGTIVKSVKCPQVGRLYNGMGPDVEWGQWCGHLVSGHGTNASNHIFYSFGNFWHHYQVSQGSTRGPVPQRDGS